MRRVNKKKITADQRRVRKARALKAWAAKKGIVFQRVADALNLTKGHVSQVLSFKRRSAPVILHLIEQYQVPKNLLRGMYGNVSDHRRRESSG